MTTAPTETHLARRPLTLLAAAALLAGACIAGCGSIDASDDTTDSARRLSSLETPCGPDSAFTGASLLDRLTTPYTAALVGGDETDSSTVRLDVTYDGGARRCVGRARSDAARLELGVTLELRTADGAIDATLPGTISILAGSNQVRFSGAAPLAAKDIQVPSTGSDNATPGPPPTRVLVEGWIATDRSDFQGAVRVMREHGDDLWNHHTVASWGTTPPTSTTSP